MIVPAAAGRQNPQLARGQATRYRDRAVATSMREAHLVFHRSFSTRATWLPAFLHGVEPAFLIELRLGQGRRLFVISSSPRLRERHWLFVISSSPWLGEGHWLFVISSSPWLSQRRWLFVISSSPRPSERRWLFVISSSPRLRERRRLFVISSSSLAQSKTLAATVLHAKGGGAKGAASQVEEISCDQRRK